MQMRSRSSRLFIVLLHLVGVSTNLPKHYSQYIWNGIVGVHPVDILSETLELDAVGGLDGLLARLPSGYADALLSQPYWLQDDADGRCLGPTGFSECGDATLWLVKRRSNGELTEENTETETQKSRFFSLFSPGQIYESHRTQGKNWGYALQLINIDDHNPVSSVSDEINTESPSQQRKFQKKEKKRLRQEEREQECLVTQDKRRQKKEKSSDTSAKTSLHLGKCSNSKAWNWRIDGKGVLSKELTLNTDKVASPDARSICIWREGNSTTAFITSCESNRKDSQERIVGFSLIRFQSSPTVHKNAMANGEASSPADSTEVPDDTSISPDLTNSPDDTVKTSVEDIFSEVPTQGVNNLPHTMTLSGVHAQRPILHPELEPMSTLLFTPLSAARIATRKPTTVSLTPGKTASATNLGTQKITTPGKQNVQLHASKRQIPVHPYIAASNNQIWVDPQTGLEFLTDFCEYLGHERKESGRHTLVGVGQYLKTVFKVKVYGVALYVSKRDVLADPTMGKYASHTTTQLQESNEFYDYLRSEPTSTQGRIDRTLLVKINMQLGTDTMRSSMEADWKMLTDEDKDVLISSSFKARPAGEKMLKKIKSEENPSRCSCAQMAPEEYEADPSCCARGTELAFTWRKNGDLEVRLDGTLMDSFPRPGLASGMFYEYLRNDDPISPDAKLRFADGFPFLLAPLAQVKGLYMQHSPSNDEQKQPTPPKQTRSELSRFVGDAFGAAANQATSFASWMQSELGKSVSNAAGAPKFIEQSVRGAGGYLDERRKHVTQHLMSFSAHSMGFLANKIPFLPEEWRYQTVLTSIVSLDGQEWDRVHRILPNRSQLTRSCDSDESNTCQSDTVNDEYSYYGGASRLFDELGIVMPTAPDFTHKLYLYMVHFYLMLLLIVSIPEYHKTRLVVTRRRRKSMDGRSICAGSIEKWDVSFHVTRKDEKNGEEHELSKGSQNYERTTTNPSNIRQNIPTSNIKKSLSYYL